MFITYDQIPVNCHYHVLLDKHNLLSCVQNFVYLKTNVSSKKLLQNLINRVSTKDK